MIFIGIGSNLSSKFGNKIKNIELAISLLKQEGINILKKSSFYETYSQPNIQDPKFVNIVISVSTKLQPTELMELLLNIEKKLVYPDHYKFSKTEITKLVDNFKKKNFQIIMTEKDYFKIKDYNIPDINFLKVRLVIKDQDKLIKRIMKMYDKTI